MRKLLIIIMMALAPLRSWAGDVMAISMAAAPATVAALAAAELVPVLAAAGGVEPVKTDSTTHGDCLGHVSNGEVAVQDLGMPEEAAASVHCQNCSFCQACSSPGLAMTGNLTGAPRLAHMVPPSGGTHFSSAERAPGFKPPIS